MNLTHSTAAAAGTNALLNSTTALHWRWAEEALALPCMYNFRIHTFSLCFTCSVSLHYICLVMSQYMHCYYHQYYIVSGSFYHHHNALCVTSYSAAYMWNRSGFFTSRYIICLLITYSYWIFMPQEKERETHRVAQHLVIYNSITQMVIHLNWKKNND